MREGRKGKPKRWSKRKRKGSRLTGGEERRSRRRSGLLEGIREGPETKRKRRRRRRKRVKTTKKTKKKKKKKNNNISRSFDLDF